MARVLEVIWVRRKRKYFCEEDWTGGINLKLKEIFPPSFRATAILIDPCTGALGATSYWISIAAAPPGRGSYVGARGTGGLGCSRRFGPCYQSTRVRPAPNAQRVQGRISEAYPPLHPPQRRGYAGARLGGHAPRGRPY